MKLIAVISHDNYYSQFYHPFCELVQWTALFCVLFVSYFGVLLRTRADM
jgi:hypothetical protein